ncbi:MAG TPA: flagellar export protein FliJ [Methylophilaceae bacterium]|nr:flagellar export protein FliJ [Methylophilaceae bacterium]
MATQSTHVLKMLKEIAAKEVDVAAEAMAHAMKAAEDAQSKHDLLRDYRQGYIDQLTKMLESGITAEAYQNFQNFLKKLDQAMAGQLEVVSMAKHQVQIQREQWQEAQRKKLSYEVLTQRSDKRELQAEQKKDQKLMDEFAMRISRAGNK